MSSRASKGQKEASWDQKLRKGFKGGVLSDLPNAITVLSEHPSWRGVIVYDEFRETVMTTRPPPWDPNDAPATCTAGEWSDEDTTRTLSWLARVLDMSPTPLVVEKAIEVVARRRTVHGPREWVRSQKWDREKRLDTWLTTYLGVEDTPYARGIGAKWMISAVARIERPGCQCDYALILESPEQGQRKSSAYRTLVSDPAWFSETPITFGEKDAMQNLRGVWIYLLDELDSVRRAENTKTKNFLTCPRDRYRASYGRRPRNYERQCVFGGTTNEAEYLTDRTGNRRYWPVRVGKIDLVALKRDRGQLFAEAAVRFKAGEKWWPDRTLEALCAQEQSSRVIPDDWDDPVREYCETHDDGSGVRTVDILCGAIGLELSKIVTQRDTPRCAAVLRGLGYTRERVRDGEQTAGEKGRAQRWRYVLSPALAKRQAERFATAQLARDEKAKTPRKSQGETSESPKNPPQHLQLVTSSKSLPPFDGVSLVSPPTKQGSPR